MLPAPLIHCPLWTVATRAIPYCCSCSRFHNRRHWPIPLPGQFIPWLLDLSPVHDLLEKTDMLSYKLVATPTDSKSKLFAFDGEPMTNATLYRSVVDALQYLTFICPDISYAVQHMCLFMHAPHLPHWIAVKCILRYIKGTIDHGLVISPVNFNQLVAYADADWVS